MTKLVLTPLSRKLVLVDGNAILHRAYHALPKNLTTQNNEPINAVYGFVSMLLRIIQDLKPTHIAVCFDRKEPTFRNKMFDKYQAQRPAMDKELAGQFEKARAVSGAMGIPVYSKVGYEADDVIGTLSLKATKADFNEVDIVTGDRDILQLVNTKVKVYLPIKGMSVGRLYGVEDVIEKMGVTPPQIIDYKGLVGDQSDNYPGASGIGPKTATTLLEKYGSFENIYNNLDEISKSTKKKLEDGRESGELSFELAKIVTDAQVDFEEDRMKKWRVDNDEVLKLFSKYGFRTLTKRIKEVGKKLDEEKQGELF